MEVTYRVCRHVFLQGRDGTVMEIAHGALVLEACGMHRRVTISAPVLLHSVRQIR